MRHCPLAVPGVKGRVTATADGFVVELGVADAASAEEVLERAQRHRPSASAAR